MSNLISNVPIESGVVPDPFDPLNTESFLSQAASQIGIENQLPGIDPILRADAHRQTLDYVAQCVATSMYRHRELCERYYKGWQALSAPIDIDPRVLDEQTRCQFRCKAMFLFAILNESRVFDALAKVLPKEFYESQETYKGVNPHDRGVVFNHDKQWGDAAMPFAYYWFSPQTEVQFYGPNVVTMISAFIESIEKQQNEAKERKDTRWQHLVFTAVHPDLANKVQMAATSLIKERPIRLAKYTQIPASEYPNLRIVSEEYQMYLSWMHFVGRGIKSDSLETAFKAQFGGIVDDAFMERMLNYQQYLFTTAYEIARRVEHERVFGIEHLTSTDNRFIRLVERVTLEMRTTHACQLWGALQTCPTIWEVREVTLLIVESMIVRILRSGPKDIYRFMQFIDSFDPFDLSKMLGRRELNDGSARRVSLTLNDYSNDICNLRWQLCHTLLGLSMSTKYEVFHQLASTDAYYVNKSSKNSMLTMIPHMRGIPSDRYSARALDDPPEADMMFGFHHLTFLECLGQSGIAERALAGVARLIHPFTLQDPAVKTHFDNFVDGLRWVISSQFKAEFCKSVRTNNEQIKKTTM